MKKSKKLIKEKRDKYNSNKPLSKSFDDWINNYKYILSNPLVDKAIQAEVEKKYGNIKEKKIK